MIEVINLIISLCLLVKGLFNVLSNLLVSTLYLGLAPESVRLSYLSHNLINNESLRINNKNAC